MTFIRSSPSAESSIFSLFIKISCCFENLNYITKLNNAQTLLESTNYTINEISNLIGYDNQLYFSRLFRKQKGMSPQ